MIFQYKVLVDELSTFDHGVALYHTELILLVTRTLATSTIIRLIS